MGIDIAKNVFAIHGVDETDEAVLVRPAVKCAAFLELIAKLPHCLICIDSLNSLTV
jgi:transposase